MFDDTTSDGQYRDRVHAYNAMIAGLALKALGAVCKNSPQACDTEAMPANAAPASQDIQPQHPAP